MHRLKLTLSLLRSDIRSIAAICHSFEVPLLVDEAHGGHFHFHSAFPDTALQSGADVAIQSTHKVSLSSWPFTGLPAYTFVQPASKL